MKISKTLERRLADRERRKIEADEDRAAIATVREVSDTTKAFIAAGSRPNRPAPTSPHDEPQEAADAGKAEGEGKEPEATQGDTAADGKGKAGAASGWKANA